MEIQHLKNQIKSLNSSLALTKEVDMEALRFNVVLFDSITSANSKLVSTIKSFETILEKLEMQDRTNVYQKRIASLKETALRHAPGVAMTRVRNLREEYYADTEANLLIIDHSLEIDMKNLVTYMQTVLLDALDPSDYMDEIDLMLEGTEPFSSERNDLLRDAADKREHELSKTIESQVKADALKIAHELEEAGIEVEIEETVEFRIKNPAFEKSVSEMRRAIYNAQRNGEGDEQCLTESYNEYLSMNREYFTFEYIINVLSDLVMQTTSPDEEISIVNDIKSIDNYRCQVEEYTLDASKLASIKDQIIDILAKYRQFKELTADITDNNGMKEWRTLEEHASITLVYLKGEIHANVDNETVCLALLTDQDKLENFLSMNDRHKHISMQNEIKNIIVKYRK